MNVSEYLPTVEMPVWVEDGPAPAATFRWDTYTTLGPFKPKRHNPYGKRWQHEGRHYPKAARGTMLKWAHSKLREAGEFLVGAFQPIRDAV